MATATINGAELWYEWSGKGEPVVHIHGGGLGHGNFGHLTPLMVDRYSVLDLDLRGYGNSSRSSGEYSFKIWADDVAALMRTVGLEQAHVHGTSTGGMIAVQLAVDHAELLRSLVLTCTAGKVDYAGWLMFQVWIEIMEHLGLEDRTLAMLLALEGFSRDFLDGPDGREIVETIRSTIASSCSVEVFVAACKAFQNADFGPHLAEITVPTMVMTGAEDVMTPVDVGPSGIGSRKLAELIPSAELVLLEGAGHTHLYQKPHESAAPILDFLDRVSGSA